ncbi:MAG TPA: FAD-dependent oxidoreductase, partial [Candidatus Gracilibacteria bacterium]|nr:FAD-dependent oxidoreductase [Candidatus Gracilibacteria bacterium]
MTYDVLIVGGGVAAYSAAMYARRFSLSVALVAEAEGGAIAQTHLVENYPGFESISGWELSQKVANHAKKFDLDPIFARVEKLQKIGDQFEADLSNGEKITSLTVILATGTHDRELGIPSEKQFKNRGVSYCATCDGAFFRGQTVAVVGGSDSAVKESLLLSTYCPKVYLLVRGESIKAEPINLERLKNTPQIEVLTQVNVQEIQGENRVERVLLDNGEFLDLKGLFIEIGRLPQNDLAKGLGALLNNKGEVITNKYTETNIPGFFAAGDISDNVFK